MIPELLESRHMAPQRRFRGQRRHFAGVAARAKKFAHPLSADAWWDYSHYHADWRGWGNLSPTYRLQYIKALAVVFNTIVEASPRIQGPFQTWIELSDRDAGEDAVFTHSPNPNGTPFPMPLEQVDWSDDRIRGLFEPMLPGLDLQFGHQRARDNSTDPSSEFSTFFIYCTGIGTDLRTTT